MGQTMSNASRLESSNPLVMFALIVLGVVGVSSFLAMPVIVSALAGGSDFSDAQIARFSFVQLFSLSIGCVLSLALSRRLSIRSMAALALILLIVADAIAPFAGSYEGFLALRAVGGIAGGIAVSTTTAALARLSNADRAFGWFLFTQIAFQMAATWILPQLVESFGMPAVFVTLALVEALVLIALLRSIPQVSIAQAAAG